MTSSPTTDPVVPGRGRDRRIVWLAALACALAGAAVFQFFGNANHGYIDTNSLFWWWIFQWINPASETEHGWLILGIAAWLLWRNLGRESRTPIARTEHRTSNIEHPTSKSDPNYQLQTTNYSRGGATAVVVTMVAGLGLHAIGFAAQQARVSIIALLIFSWGMLRLGGGRRWGAAAVFPLGFLVFAMPLTVLDSAGFWLRMWVIDAASKFARVAHIEVLRNGTQLIAPDGRFNYDVAPACSGVRSLMALTALSLLIGYLNFRSWWRRALMLLLCFPLVYMGNVARITSIIFAAQLGGQGWGKLAHDVMGWGIFVIVLGGVLGCAALLWRWWPEGMGESNRQQVTGDGRDEQRDQAVASPVQTLTEDTDGRAARPYLIACVIIALAIGEMVFLHRLATQPPKGMVGVVLAADGQNPVELPTFLGRDWVGWPATVTAIEREILPTDTGFSRMEYVGSRDAHHVFLSLVLSGRDRTSIHRPELCLLGQGWTITGRAVREFAYPGKSAFRATVLKVQRQQRGPTGTVTVPQLVAYWFVSGDTVAATHWERLALDGWNRVFHARADRWAYVLIQTDATDGEPAALKRMTAVLESTLPVFQKVSAQEERRGLSAKP
jgi:EpsI family protein